MKRGETLHETDETVSETFPTVLHNITGQDKQTGQTNRQEILVENPSDVSTDPNFAFDELDPYLDAAFWEAKEREEPERKRRLLFMQELASESSGEVVRSLPLLDGEVFEIRESFVAKLKEAFPEVDVVEQIDRIGRGLRSGSYMLRDKSLTIAFIAGRCDEY